MYSRNLQARQSARTSFFQKIYLGKDLHDHTSQTGSETRSLFCSSRDAKHAQQVSEQTWEDAISPFKWLKMLNMRHNTKNHIQLRCCPAMPFMLASNWACPYPLCGFDRCPMRSGSLPLCFILAYFSSAKLEANSDFCSSSINSSIKDTQIFALGPPDKHRDQGLLLSQTSSSGVRRVGVLSFSVSHMCSRWTWCIWTL